MYLKLSAKNEEFQLLFLDEEGLEFNPGLPLSIKLFNKIGTTYQAFQTETTQKFEYINSRLTDKKVMFVDVTLNNVLLKAKIKVEVVTTETRVRYKVTYETTYPFRKLSTTFLRRISLGMPAWSTAFKNDISVFSKVFYPLYLIPERLYYKTKEALNNNLTNKNYKRSIQTRSTIAVAKKENGDIISRTFIKEKEMINSITTEKIDQKNINLFSYIADDKIPYPVKLDPTFSKVFIKSDKACLINIIGINKRRIPVNEHIFCDGVVFTRSFLDYKEITAIQVLKVSGYEDPTIEVTNHMNLKKYQNNFRTNVMTGNPDDNKDFEVPLYLYNADTHSVKTFFAKEWIQEEDGSVEYFVPLLEGNNGFFVTEDEDIVSISPRVSLGTEENHDTLLTEINQRILTETALYKVYAGLLRRNLEVDLELHSSNNNNSIVSIMDESSAANTGMVEVQIITKDIVENYGNVSVQISVNVDGNIFYLDESNDWVEQPVYKLLNNINPIYVTQDVKNCTYFSVILEFNTVKYQASHVKHYVDMTPFDVYVKSAYHNGQDVIVMKEDGLHKLIITKDYYEFIDDNHIQYDNFTNNTTLIDERGYKDGEYTV